MFPSVNEQMDTIRRGVVDLLPEDELVKKLERSYKENRPLIVKLGCDPSRPDLHLGHTVVLRKMRHFQELGHQAVLIVGDFTGMIGDPSGKSATRPALSLEETRENGRSYFEQASKVLDSKRIKIVYNSDWLGEMSFEDVIRLASKYTVARMLERDEFEKRYKAGEAISVHEFLYPLAQAMDSVAIQADVELGGTDQKFNLLVGRDIQREYGQEPQVILTMPILAGTDGVQKMSKSLDNYIGVSESAGDIYGKTLSIADHLMYEYFELATSVSQKELDEIHAQITQHPRDVKRRLARELVTLYHSREAAVAAEEEFDRIFIKKAVPETIEAFSPETDDASIWIVKLMTESGMAQSNGEGRRLVKQGAVSIDGEKVSDPDMELALDRAFVLKVGKRRFMKIVPKAK
ncbi:tyrosine--tRNA ligase [candidate division KSB3 bacterium]|uniref:Tyrosine--tRNA ligase n=1 Tax=candidate division KSB3 bacterium TaxID=2044937 RepID=A0A2G6EBD5_9BACT|nr:MAG: tyrosine--tRNA ligase [candidate division KSB3 bacterium]PIE30747.1 MAG: tyrosine--tRNA ligase [candidate division KSB3 bacterium]